MTKAETITCISGGFPANLARLNNVDKACLDDVASRLRQDPRSRVVIVGHADSGGDGTPTSSPASAARPSRRTW